MLPNLSLNMQLQNQLRTNDQNFFAEMQNYLAKNSQLSW